MAGIIKRKDRPNKNMKYKMIKPKYLSQPFLPNKIISWKLNLSFKEALVIPLSANNKKNQIIKLKISAKTIETGLIEEKSEKSSIIEPVNNKLINGKINWGKLIKKNVVVKIGLKLVLKFLNDFLNKEAKLIKI